MPLTRRDLTTTSACVGVALAGSVGVLASAPGALAESATGTVANRSGLGYGPFIAAPDGLLALPAGFSYRVITRSGVTALESGEPTPSHHDGTATFDGTRGSTLLVNNHEPKGPRADRPYPVPPTEGLVYDPAAAGGCTVVEVSRHGDHVAEWSASRAPRRTAPAGGPPGVPG